MKSRIDLKKLIKEVEQETRSDDKEEAVVKADIIRCMNDPDTTGFALCFVTDEGGGTLGAIPSDQREKMAKTALHLVADLARREVMDDE